MTPVTTGSLTVSRAAGPRRVDRFSTLAKVLAGAYLAVLTFVLIATFLQLFGGDNLVGRAFATRGVGEAIRNSGIIVLVSVPLALVIGTLFGWLNERTDAGMGRFSELLPLLPFVVPGIAISIGWIFLGSERAGLLNAFTRMVGEWFGFDGVAPFNITTWVGLIFVYTLDLVPLAFLVVSAAFRNVDGAKDEASRMSGAGVFRTLRRVSIPSVMPAIMSAVLLTVVHSVAMFSVPTVIGTAAGINVLPVHIVRLVRDSNPPQIGEAVVLSGLIFAVVMAVWLLQGTIARQGHHATIVGKVSRPTPVRLGGWRWVARGSMILYILAASVAPVAALALVALQPFWQPKLDFAALTLNNLGIVFAPGSQTLKAFINSVTLGALGATIGVLLGAVLMVYVHQRRSRFGRLVDGATKLPATLSHIVIGIAFVALTTLAPSLQGTAVLLLAYIVVYMPQASTTVGSASEQVGQELVEASRMAGGTGLRTFLRINFPLMIPGMTAAWALLFVLIMGDLTVSALLSGTRQPVIGFVILAIWENGTYSQLAMLALVVTLLSGLVVGVLMSVSRKLGHGRANVTL